MISRQSTANLPPPSVHVTRIPVILNNCTALDLWRLFRLSAWNADPTPHLHSSLQMFSSIG